MRLGCVELGVFGELGWEIGLGVDRVHGAHIDTGRAIDALLGMNYQLVVQFVKTGNRAHLHTIGELAASTFLSDDVGHGLC